MRYVAKVFGYSFGVLFVLLSIVGFGVTGFTEWLKPDVDYHLIVFRMNAAQNLIHMLLGMALMTGAAGTEAVARRTALITGLLFGVLGFYGFYVVETEMNVIATNEAMSLLHLATAGIALLAALVSQPDEETAEESA